MRNRHQLWIAGFFAVLGACGGGHDAPALPEDTTDGSPPLPPAGWSIVEGPTPYNVDSLFEYLNGGAPLYLNYGFQGLTQCRYQLGDDPFASVTLDVYDMGSDLGAFGLYRSILPPGADTEDWGVEGYLSGTIAAAWRGSVYVHGEADDSRPELVEVLKLLVSSAVDATGAPESLPSILQYLPVAGRVARSERYLAVDLFGHAFLPGGVLATYEVDEGEIELFFTELPGTPETEEAIERLRAHQQEWGDVGDDVMDLGDGGFRFTDPGLGPGVVVRRGHFIVGAHGAASADEYVRELLVLLPRE